jgi:hypothetical protein
MKIRPEAGRTSARFQLVSFAPPAHPHPPTNTGSDDKGVQKKVMARLQSHCGLRNCPRGATEFSPALQRPYGFFDRGGSVARVNSLPANGDFMQSR